MAKTKSKKKGLSEIKNAKPKNRKDSLNPFEVQVNKQKFHVLGRKMKLDRGLPGIARSKAIKKRKETLLQEYKVKDKSSKFIDRRIGERDSAMTKEDRILARFTAERLKAHKRKSMFNLGEDEVLTHKGRSIAEIENFDDPSSDDNDDKNEKGKLDASFVEEAHFGGGLFKKADESKGRAAIIEQLIAESKKRKAEKQEAKEKTKEKTEQLDSEWRELMPMVANSGKSLGTSAEPDFVKKDPYDLIVKQLIFEARGTPSDRLKSENEIAAEEARKLRELEEERLKRMRGEDVETPVAKRKHRSADDLDDGLDIDDDDDFELIYDKEGKLITIIPDEDQEPQTKSTASDDLENREYSEEEEEDDDEDSGEEDDEGNEDGSEGEAVYDLSDMRTAETNEESEEEEADELVNVQEKKKCLKRKDADKFPANEETNKKSVAFDPVVKTFDVPKLDKKSVEDEAKKQRILDEANLGLPFTFEVPASYDDFFEILAEKDLSEQKIIIERMIKCNHPSLNEENKPKLNVLFAFILQLLNDSDHLDCWVLLDAMGPFLFELTKFSPTEAATSLLDVITEKRNEYLEKKHRYPTTETLVFLKLVPLLFPTSDKRHPVTTPSIVFMSEMLRECQVTTRRSITTGLFLVTLYTEYVSLSKRILPEALNLLCGVLHMASPVHAKGGLIVPPFRQEHKFLFLHKPCTDLTDKDLLMSTKDLAPKSVKIDDKFRVRSIYLALNLIRIVIDLWKSTPGCWLILAPIMDHVEALELDKYPTVISKTVELIIKSLDEIKNEGFKRIIKEAEKPKALRQYDPAIRPVYDKRLRMRETDKKVEQKKLLTKYRKEMKGALREIRRDRTFLAKVKFNEIAKSDAERIRKVKEIYSWGSQQQGELNKMDRKKKFKK